MAREMGKDWRIAIVAGGASAAVTIGGETGFEWSRSSAEIDTASKDDGNYGSTDYGRQSISIRVQGKLNLPDVGLELASDASKASTPVTMQVLKGDVVKYEGLTSIGNFSTNFNDGEQATYSFDARNTGAPTIDDLGATS